MSRYEQGADFDQVHERPSWLLPLVILGMTLSLCLVVWWYYLGYSVDELTGNTLSGTERGRILHVSIGGHALDIPANFTQYPRDRRDGSREAIELFTVLPDFAAYSANRKDEFLSNGPASPVIIFKISAHNVALTEDERITTYLGRADAGQGDVTEFGLREYEMGLGQSLERQDMYVFETTAGLKGMIRCLRRSEGIDAPFCWRETELANGLTLHYRFRRAHLNQWRTIDQGVLTLVESFLRLDPSKPPSQS